MGQVRARPLRWSFEVSRFPAAPVLVLVAEGRLGAGAAQALREALVGAMAEGHRRLVVDLAGVDYVSSAGLVLFEEAQRELDAQGGRLVLAALSEPVRVTIELSGMARGLPIEATRDAAVTRAAL